MGTVKDEIQIYDLVNISNNVYYSKIMYKNSELSIQTNKNSLVLNKEKCKAKLNINEETSNFIKEVSRAIIELTSEKSNEFFGKDISVEDCENIYKEALVGNVLHCFYDEETHFYKSKNNNIELEDLPSEIEGISLLRASAVVYTKTSFFIRWEITQFKIKKPKEPEEIFKFEEYIIKDLPEHEFPIDGDPLANKLEEICFF